jgi:hypothetical protein
VKKSCMIIHFDLPRHDLALASKMLHSEAKAYANSDCDNLAHACIAAAMLVDAAMAVTEETIPAPTPAPLSHKVAIEAVTRWAAKEIIRTPLSEEFITRMVHIALQAARPHLQEPTHLHTLEG